MKKKLILVLILCVVCIAVLTRQLDRVRTTRERLEEKLIYIPGGKFIKTASLGFHAVVADVLWARAVVYFGGHFLTDKDYRWLYHILDAATTLDPHNILAYRFGGTLLTLEEDDVESSMALLKKGIRNNPDEDWRLYFLVGFNYFFYMEDYAAAGEYLERASKMPGHPAYLPRLAAKMYAKAGKTDIAIEFLKETYRQYDDEKVRQSIADRINILLARKNIGPIQDAVDVYKKIYGEYPTDIEELVRAGLIRNLVYPGGRYTIDPAGKVEFELDDSWP